MKHIIYRVFKRLGILKSFVKQIETRMEILYPKSREKVIRYTELELIKIFIVTCIVIASIVIYGKVSMVYVFMAACVIGVLTKSIVYARYDQLEIKLLRQFERFINDVKFRFKYDGMIDEAILEAVYNSDYEMSLQGSLIYESLNDSGVYGREDNFGMNIRDFDNSSADYDNYGIKNDYIEIAPNHFFMTFYAMCETVKNYGDKYVDGKSVFMTNLLYLKDDVNVELLKREKINALFMGLIGVTILPLFAIKPICIWGMGNIRGLADYYNGILGNITIIIITIITVLIAGIIMKLKYPADYDNDKNEVLTAILRISWVDSILMRIIRSRYKHYYAQDLFLKSIVYRYNAKEFLLYRIVCGIMAFVVSMLLLVSIGLYKGGALAAVIMFLMVGLVVIFAYYYEFILLLIRQRLLKLNREEEVVRFQSIILILMDMDRISIEVILHWMEKFAVVFKNHIEVISDNITYKGSKIFSEMKEKINFLPFERLLDCFAACDKVGIRRAFSDIIADRIYYVEKHKQENELIISDKAMIAKLLAFIPICMVIIFVLVVPFIYEGLLRIWEFNLM